MNLKEFFQIRGIFTNYVGRMFALRFLGLLIFFIILLQMLDLLNNSKEIAAAEGADWRSIAKYISLRGPQIASQFTPFAALLGIVATLAALSQRSEITIMRAAGMSVQKVLFPIGFFCLLITIAHFTFNELVSVSATERLAYWEANDYAVDLPDNVGTRTDIQFIYDDEIIRADSAARIGKTVVLRDVQLLDLDDAGLTTQIYGAETARYEDGKWNLFNAIRLDPETLTNSRTDKVAWDTTLDPELLFAISLNPDRTSLPGLIRQIGQLNKDGADTRSAMTSFLSRFSKPMSTLVMPLLGAIAGFGVTRQGAQLFRAVTGAALGFGYFVTENLMIALGKLGAIPAVFGSFFTFMIFLVVGFAILLTMEN